MQHCRREGRSFGVGSAITSAIFGAAILVVSGVSPGCGSISDSVDSISDSVNNAFESVSNSFAASSNSSSPGGAEQALLNYERDVTGYAVAWLERDPAGDPEGGELLRGVGFIAGLHGISDWEAAPATRSALLAASKDPQLDETDRARLQSELDRIEARDSAAATGSDPRP